MSARELSEIWVYPIKSMGGVRISSAKILLKGLQYDRRWMLVNEEGEFLTQRAHPKLALFKLLMDDEKMTIMKGHHSITLPFVHPVINLPLHVKIWDDEVMANEVSSIHSQWFSDLLGMKCKLVFFPEENSRLVDPTYAVNKEHVSLADAYPFLIIGQSSLDDLNSRLKNPLPMNRFRPNFVFTGGTPYEEDTWRNFSIGNNRFIAVKPCSRCIMTTVNQDTAEKSNEPLRTLSTYRKNNNKIYFGQNVVALDSFEIKAKDKILLY